MDGWWARYVPVFLSLSSLFHHQSSLRTGTETAASTWTADVPGTYLRVLLSLSSLFHHPLSLKTGTEMAAFTWTADEPGTFLRVLLSLLSLSHHLSSLRTGTETAASTWTADAPGTYVYYCPCSTALVIKDWDRDSGIYMDGWCARYLRVLLSLFHRPSSLRTGTETAAFTWTADAPGTYLRVILSLPSLFHRPSSLRTGTETAAFTWTADAPGTYLRVLLSLSSLFHHQSSLRTGTETADAPGTYRVLLSTQCSGSVTFWYGSGSAIRNTDLWIRILIFSSVADKMPKFFS